MLFDNIFFNDIIEAITSSNFVSDISDHLVQFLITPNVLENYKRSIKDVSKKLMKAFLQMISKNLNGKLSIRLTWMIWTFLSVNLFWN